MALQILAQLLRKIGDNLAMGKIGEEDVDGGVPFAVKQCSPCLLIVTGDVTLV